MLLVLVPNRLRRRRRLRLPRYDPEELPVAGLPLLEDNPNHVLHHHLRAVEEDEVVVEEGEDEEEEEEEEAQPRKQGLVRLQRRVVRRLLWREAGPLLRPHPR